MQQGGKINPRGCGKGCSREGRSLPGGVEKKCNQEKDNRERDNQERDNQGRENQGRENQERDKRRANRGGVVRGGPGEKIPPAVARKGGRAAGRGLSVAM